MPRRARHPAPHGSQAGFTLIEILTAILILGVLMSVLMFTLTGTMRLNRQSGQQIDSASRAQDVLEKIRGAWNTPDGVNYARICAPLTLPDGVSATVTNLTSRAQPSGTEQPVRVVPPGTTCASYPIDTAPDGSLPPMRRLSIRTGDTAQDTILTLDVVK